jgi:hypothetical protein
VLVLDDATPERDSSEHTRNGRGLVPSVQISPEQCRLAYRVDPARAFDVRRDVVEVAQRDHVGPPRPGGFADDRGKSQPIRGLLHAPDAPPFGVLDDA